MRSRLLLGFLLVALLLLRVDTLHLGPGKALASEHLFSLEQWEASNFLRKWLNLLYETLPGKKPSRDERLAQLHEFLRLAKLAQKEKNRLDGLYFRRSTTLNSGDITKGGASPSDEYLNELLKAREQLRPTAEEGMEAELSAVLKDEGLGSRIGFLFPPVDLRFDKRPTVLIVSPRDRIQLREVVLLRPELPVLERASLEENILDRYNLSAFVDDLGGLATYPAVIPDDYPLRTILQTAAHEWLHQYFFFRSLGRHMRDSEEMLTINETAAEMAGRELGDKVFARIGGDLSISPSRFLSQEERDPVFTREMRKTRLRVDELLSEGKIEEAEQYMKERWWFFVLRGYALRKLNQAYFAFRGSYAEGAASVSLVGDQLKELRSLLPSVGAFVNTISKVSSYENLVDLLGDLKVQAGSESHSDKGTSNSLISASP